MSACTVFCFFSTGCVRLQVFFRGQGKSLTHSHQLTTDSFCKFQASCTTQCIIQTFFKHVSDLSHINKGTLTDIPICYITAKYVAKYMKCDVAERFVCVLLSEDMLRLLFSLQLLLWIHLFVAIMWLKHKLFCSQKNFAVHPCRIVWCFGINNGAISSTWCTFCQILCLYDSLKNSPTQILCVHAVDSQSCLYTLFHRV